MFSNQNLSPSRTRVNWSMMTVLKSGPGPASLNSSSPPGNTSSRDVSFPYNRRSFFRVCEAGMKTPCRNERDQEIKKILGTVAHFCYAVRVKFFTGLGTAWPPSICAGGQARVKLSWHKRKRIPVLSESCKAQHSVSP